MKISERDIEQARLRFLAQLLKGFEIPGNTDRLVKPFRAWLRAKGINPDTQRMDGNLFKKFLRERKHNAAKAIERAHAAIGLFELVSPLYTSGEAVEQAQEIDGQNNCIMQYIHSGVIPDVKAEKGGNMFENARAVGHNNARRKLLKKFPPKKIRGKKQ